MRREFTRKTKLLAFARANGRCEVPWCGARLTIGQFIYDHRIPDQMGGDNSLDNCQVICRVCDKDKTRKDQGDIAKTNRVLAKHRGVKTQRSRPLPGTRASGIRKRLNGTVESW